MDSFSAAVSRLALRLPSPLVRLRDPFFDEHGVTLYLKRDDLIHADLPGNKWRKLKYNIKAAKQCGASTLLTFGGAYSNHLKAVAAASRHFGFKSIGMVRGERHDPLNDVLAFAEDHGMELVYMDRDTYRRKSSPDVLATLHSSFGEFFVIPEGGSNAYAVHGCAELVEEIDVTFDYICCPCGTGGTLAGIASGLCAGQGAVGFSVLKGGEFLNGEVMRLQNAALGHITDNWWIEQDFHFGGFAKSTSTLDEFIKALKQSHGILLDWVYVAKMMYGLASMIDHDRFGNDSNIIAVITG